MSPAEPGTGLDDVRVPQPPDGLRAGQLGVVVLGEVVMGDIAVTLVDLAQRTWLRIEEADDDWRLSPQTVPSAGQPPTDLLGYEKVLLEGLSAEGHACRLSLLGPAMGHRLGDVRTALIKEAVRQGWLRHLHHDTDTQAGRELADSIRSFRGDLSKLATRYGNQALAGELMPYALHFGLLTTGAAPLARFAQAWVERFKNMVSWSAHRQQPRGPGDGAEGQGLFGDRAAVDIARAAYSLGPYS
jgi:hypothetical protein